MRRFQARGRYWPYRRRWEWSMEWKCLRMGESRDGMLSRLPQKESQPCPRNRRREGDVDQWEHREKGLNFGDLFYFEKKEDQLMRFGDGGGIGTQVWGEYRKLKELHQGTKSCWEKPWVSGQCRGSADFWWSLNLFSVWKWSLSLSHALVMCRIIPTTLS